VSATQRAPHFLIALLVNFLLTAQFVLPVTTFQDDTHGFLAFICWNRSRTGFFYFVTTFENMSYFLVTGSVWVLFKALFVFPVTTLENDCGGFYADAFRNGF